MSLRWKTWNTALISLGLALIIISLIWLLVIFPTMNKIPADHNRVINFEGFYKVMNPVTRTLDEIPVNVTRVQQALEVQDNIVIIDQVITTTHAVAGIELDQFGLTEVLGVDRSTRQYIAGYGDMDRSGQFCFPDGVGKRSYSMWVPSAGRPLEAKFVSEEDFQGIKVYNFKISELGLDMGVQSETGLPQDMDAVIRLKVEPVSGVTVYTESQTYINIIPMPNLKTAVYISSLEFTEDTLAEMVDTAASSRSKLLWASVYGFYLGIGLGCVLTLFGVVRAIRNR